MIEQLLTKITATLKSCPGVEAVVLGGSRATGTAGVNSDIDIGIYYNRSLLDYASLNAAAAGLDDKHRTGLICREGEWGSWVNFGGWLQMEGIPVDLIFRDAARVQSIVEETEAGKFSINYQTGHPHAFISAMYRGELASCRVLYARNEAFAALKKQAEFYPPALQKSLLEFFNFEAGFSCMLAQKCAPTGELYYLSGHIFRSISALNQVLFALNKAWCLNEKKATLRIERFALCPPDYAARVNSIIANTGTNTSQALKELQALCDEVMEMQK